MYIFSVGALTLEIVGVLVVLVDVLRNGVRPHQERRRNLHDAGHRVPTRHGGGGPRSTERVCVKSVVKARGLTLVRV